MARHVEIPKLAEDGANEIIQMLFWHISKSGKAYEQIAEEANLTVEAIKSWRTGTMPALDSILRCFRCLEYSLVVAESKESAFAHSGYFEMIDAIERQQEFKRTARRLPERGSPEWQERNAWKSGTDADNLLSWLDPECWPVLREQTKAALNDCKRELESTPMDKRIKASKGAEVRREKAKQELLEKKTSKRRAAAQKAIVTRRENEKQKASVNRKKRPLKR